MRPLLDDGASKAQEATRDYVLALEAPALLSVFGGKITTHRRLAEAAMAKLARLFPAMRGAWTAHAALPGGDFPWDGSEQVRTDLARRYPFLAGAQQRRFVRMYGTLAADMLVSVRCRNPDNYAHFCDPRIDAQIDWLVRSEWARTADDDSGAAASLDCGSVSPRQGRWTITSHVSLPRLPDRSARC